MLINQVEFRRVAPPPELSDIVESYWMYHNPTEQAQEVVIVPDGRIDLFFTRSETLPYHGLIRGLDNQPGMGSIPPRTTVFAVSLTLLAVEYLLATSVAPLLNGGAELPAGFWDLSAEDLTDFDRFCPAVSQRITDRLRPSVDERKRSLFRLLYASQGAVPVGELADTVHWSSRQINRYFNQWFGLSLKAYCTILRFRASFRQLREGRLFPEQNFTDQAHFIREVRKYAGVVPKVLSKNANDRFIQFSALSGE